MAQRYAYFEAYDFKLELPNASPAFTELSYSIALQVEGRPETFQRTRWFSPASADEERQLVAPESAWAGDDGDDAAVLSTTKKRPTVQRHVAGQPEVINWSGINRVMFPAKLITQSSTVFTSKHPLLVWISSSPRPPTMGIPPSCSSTRAWMVPLDDARNVLGDVASQGGALPQAHVSFCTLVPVPPTVVMPLADFSALVNAIPVAGAKLHMTFVCHFLPEGAVAPKVCPSPWVGTAAKFPFVFILDQFVLTTKRESGVEVCRDGSIVRIRVLRKHDEGGIMRRVSSRMPDGLKSITPLVELTESCRVSPLRAPLVEAAYLPLNALRRFSPPSPAVARRQAGRARRGTARRDGAAVMVCDAALPMDWLSALMNDNGVEPSQAPTASSFPIPTIPLHLETDPAIGCVMPRESKRTQLAFSVYEPSPLDGSASTTLRMSSVSDEAEADGDQQWSECGEGDTAVGGATTATNHNNGVSGKHSSWITSTSAPLNCATQLYGMENFPDHGAIFFQTFSDGVELRFRVRRFFVPHAMGQSGQHSCFTDRRVELADLLDGLNPSLSQH